MRNGGSEASIYIASPIFIKGVLGRFPTLCAPSSITHYALRITHCAKMGLHRNRRSPILHIANYSTVTDLAKFLGLSTSLPLLILV